MGRLMKYELRSAFRLFIPLWLGLLVLALVNGLGFSEEVQLRAYLTDNYLLQGLQTLMMMLYVLAIFGIVVFAYIYIIMRFYQSTMKDEGYLTFTLPLGVDSILWSKALTALILLAGSCVVFVLSLMLVLFRNIDWNDFSTVFGALNTVLDGQLPLAAAMYCVVLFVSTLSAILQVYLSMALGQLSNKHRVLVAVGAYVGINTVLSTISNLIMTPAMLWFVNNIDTMTLPDYLQRLSPAGLIWLIFAILLACSLFMCALFYFPTRYIFSKKLNLT